MAERQKLVHLHSASVKIPTAEQLNYGEIAVQYAQAEPCLYIKDSGDNIIKFVDASGVDTKIQAALSSITQTVGTLVGDDTNKSIRTISAEEVAKIVASADSRYDTLKEIADWILSDTTGAAKMANDITHLQEISADTRITALEMASGANHTHANKATLDGIDDTDIASWNAAAASAHSHANIDVLTGITSQKVADWDSAATNNHIHDNMPVLDNILQEDVNAWNTVISDLSEHTADTTVHVTTTEKNTWSGKQDAFSNSGTLATITDTKVANWDAAAASAHTHDNMSALTGVTTQKISDWDNAYATSLSAVTGIATGKDQGVVITNNQLDFSGFEIDCGAY